MVLSSTSIGINFNPRSRVGNDGVGNSASIYCSQISIHVPAWGTTSAIPDHSQHGRFQSTFPRGERRQISTIFFLYICINSINSHFNITSFCIFYLIAFFFACFFYFLWCESSGDFLYTSGSHFIGIIPDQQKSLVLFRYVLSLSDNYFQDNKNEGCPDSYQ